MTDSEGTRFANAMTHWLMDPEAEKVLRALQAGVDALYQGAPAGTTAELSVQHKAAHGLLLMVAHLPPDGERIETEDCDRFRGFREGLSLAVEGAVADLLRRRRRPIAIAAHARGKEAALAGPLDAAMESLYEAVTQALAAARSGAEA